MLVLANGCFSGSRVIGPPLEDEAVAVVVAPDDAVTVVVDAPPTPVDAVADAPPAPVVAVDVDVDASFEEHADSDNRKSERTERRPERRPMLEIEAMRSTYQNFPSSRLHDDCNAVKRAPNA